MYANYNTFTADSTAAGVVCSTAIPSYLHDCEIPLISGELALLRDCIVTCVAAGKSVYFWCLVSALGTFWLGAGVSMRHSVEELINPTVALDKARGVISILLWPLLIAFCATHNILIVT